MSCEIEVRQHVGGAMYRGTEEPRLSGCSA